MIFGAKFSGDIEMILVNYLLHCYRCYILAILDDLLHITTKLIEIVQ